MAEPVRPAEITSDLAVDHPARVTSGPRLIGARECAFFRVTVTQALARRKLVRGLVQNLTEQTLKAGVRFRKAPLQRTL
jgi:hypothetical protein